MKKPILTINNLQVGFQHEKVFQPAVDGVSLQIAAGETFTLLGESGCGKSLTAFSIMQLLPAAATISDQSKIYLHDQNLLTLPEVQLRKIRGRRIAMIFQEPMTSLNPVLTVGRQIFEVLYTHTKLRGNKAKSRVIELFDAVGLADADKLIDRYPHQLSGGMKQRVMIAMALALEPELLIADEPTSALDVTVQKQILELLKSLQQKTGMALLLITHDLGVARYMADTVAVMYAGHLVEQANKEEFFKNPLHPYSRKLFASIPTLEKRKQKLAVIPGGVPLLTTHFVGCRFTPRCDYAWQTCKEVDPRWLENSNQHFVRCHLYDSSYKDEAPLKITAESAETLKLPPHDGEVVLTLDQLKVYFPIQKGILKRTVGYIKAVDGVSLQLHQGKTLAVVGESGSGKTTLAKAVLHLESKTSGEIIFDPNLNLSMRGLRRYAQIIFQDPFSSMNPRMMVGDIIAEGMQALNIGDKTSRLLRVETLLKQVGLSQDSVFRYPHEFSGGQRQRICIARALAVDPQLIICDEPTSALDVSVQAQILNLLKQLQTEKGLSYLFISHNMAVVAYMADEIAVMYRGQIVEHGEAKHVLTTPGHPYTQKLLAAVPRVE